MDELKKEEGKKTLEGTTGTVVETATAPTETTTSSTMHESIALEPTNTPIPVDVPFYKNRSMIASLLVALLLLGGAGYYVYLKPAQDAIVAIVNGKEIRTTEFNENISLIEQNATLQGIDITDPAAQAEIRTQALDTLINNALIVTAAQNAGLTVSQEEYDVIYAELIASLGSEEVLRTRMVEVGLTQKRLENNINERILADEYIATQTGDQNLTVTDADVEAFIASLNAPEGQLPPLEEIRDEIEAEILNQRQQVLIMNILEKLRAEADIKKNI